MAGEETRERLLDAAEILFADLGFDGVGLRQIAEQAGEAVSSITYHFTSRDGLIKAVIGRRFLPINDERLRLLRAAEYAADNNTPSLPATLDAFLRPPLMALDKHTAAILPILASSFTNMTQVAESHRGAFREMIEYFLPRIRKHCPQIDNIEFVWRLHFIIGMLVRCLQSMHKTGEDSPDSEQRDALVRQLTHSAQALLSAPHAEDAVPKLVEPIQEIILSILQESADA